MRKIQLVEVNCQNQIQQIRKITKTLERLGKEYNMKNDRLDRQRLKELSKQHLEVINKFGNKVDQHKRLIWNAFKDIHEVTFNQSYTVFYKWVSYNTYTKLTETNFRKIKASQQSANVTHQLIKQETYKVFNLNKKIQISSFLDKLILKLHQRQKLDALKQIENYCVHQKMEEKLNNINKQDFISRLKDSANKTEKGLLKQILRKFYINSSTNFQDKQTLLEKMSSHYNNILRWAFIQWNNQVKSDKIAQLLDEEKKKFLIFILQRNLKHNKNGQLRDILRKFNDGGNKLILIKKYS